MAQSRSEITRHLDEGSISRDEAIILPIISDNRVKETLAMIKKSRPQGQRIDGLSLHSFPARMPLTLTDFLINRLSLPNSFVLDPMVGSGTTMIATKKNNRIGKGYDLDPFAVLLTRGATHSVCLRDFEHTSEKIYREAQLLLSKKKHKLSRVKNAMSLEDKEFISFWFPSRSEEELLALSLAISEVSVPQLQELLWIVFSGLIISKNSGASYAIDLAHSRPHRKFDKKILWPMDGWVKRSNKVKKCIHFANDNADYGHVQIEIGDARRLKEQDSTVDLVITSPPYLHAIDYMRCHKFSLVWMGYHQKDLRNIRSDLIGAQRNVKQGDIPDSIETKLSQVNNIQRRGWLKRYIIDMGLAFNEMSRVLKPGGLVVLIVGPNVISRKKYDAVEIFGELAEIAGLNVVDAVPRRLSNQRRTLPPPNLVSAGNSMKKRLKAEFVIALRKPL